MAASINRILFKNLILRNRLREVIVGSNGIFATSTPCCWLSTESNSSDDEPTSTSKSKKEEKLKHKLSSLISSLKVESSIAPEESTITINLAKPKDRRRSMRKTDQLKQTKHELPDTSSPKIDEKLVSAAKDVASSLGGDKNIIELELLQTLKAHAEETENAKRVSTKDVSNVFVGMKIDRKKEKAVPPHTSTAWPDNQYETLQSQFQELSATPAATKPQRRRTLSSIRTRTDLHSAPTLDIFNISAENVKKDFHRNEMWDKLAEHELQLLVKHPVRNGFEEMIRWTEEGKLWVFPIDNEYGLEEKKVSFHEHVFLEHLLEGFPEKGPVRHFMELVITGLSKNPYITVERKKEHVEWYRNYFKDKEEILREAGALVN